MVSPAQGQQPTCRDRDAAIAAFTVKAKVDLCTPPLQLVCKYVAGRNGLFGV